MLRRLFILGFFFVQRLNNQCSRTVVERRILHEPVGKRVSSPLGPMARTKRSRHTHPVIHDSLLVAIKGLTAIPRMDSRGWLRPLSIPRCFHTELFQTPVSALFQSSMRRKILFYPPPILISLRSVLTHICRSHNLSHTAALSFFYLPCIATNMPPRL